jgi:DNA-binding SARP family transcriptional activator
MGIAVLGPLEVDQGTTRLGHRDRVVLAALVARAGQVLTPDELADAVWGEQPPVSWHKNLQGCISRLRRALGGDGIVTTSQGYRLTVPADTMDAGQFERLVSRAEEMVRLGESDRAAYTAAQALALWRGRALPELEEWPPGLAEAGRLTQLRLAAEELHLDAQLRAGQRQDAVASARALVSAAPTRERRWALLALAQYQSGDQVAALQTLRQLRALLRNELGVDPGPDAEALQQAILRQDPELLVAIAAPSAGECPYPGLTAFDETDALPSWRLAVSWPSSARPASASRRSSGPAWRPRCEARDGTSASSCPVGSRCPRSAP